MNNSYYVYLYYIIPVICSFISSFNILDINIDELQNDNIIISTIVSALILLLYYSFIEFIDKIYSFILSIINHLTDNKSKKRILTDLKERNRKIKEEKESKLKELLNNLLGPEISNSDFDLFFNNILKFDLLEEDKWKNLKDFELCTLIDESIVKVINYNGKLTSKDLNTIGLAIGKIMEWERGKTARLLKVSFSSAYNNLSVDSIISSLSNYSGKNIKREDIKKYI